MANAQLIGIDLGGTNVRAARVQGHQPDEVLTARVPARGTVEEVLETIYSLVDRLDPASVDGIGVGVPSVVDVETGVVYDVQNIPSWQEVPLRALLEERYGRPTFVNNDANCFAAGERYFGKGQNYRSFVGLIIGTGFAGGVILDGKLYSGRNCGAGEFGMIPYRDSIFEMYCAGQFFDREYGIDGATLYRQAREGNADALRAYEAFGRHLGEGIKTVMFAYDPECIIFGGGIRVAYPFFRDAMWESIRSFAYRIAVDRLRVEVSELENAGILGAAALALDAGIIAPV